MTAQAIKASFVVYEVRADFEPTKPVFIGCCALANVADMVDAWTYTTFRDQISDGRAKLEMSIVGIFTDRKDAETGQAELVSMYDVWINQHSERCEPPARPGRARFIRNTATGDEYGTSKEAAKAIGVSPAAMCMHLSGKLHTIKGCVFERIAG